MVTKTVHACVYLVEINFTNVHLSPMQASRRRKETGSYDANDITWRPVGTCLASFTLAKLPRPIVLMRRYLPICCTSSGGFACPVLTCRAFSPDTWLKQTAAHHYWQKIRATELNNDSPLFNSNQWHSVNATFIIIIYQKIINLCAAAVILDVFI